VSQTSPEISILAWLPLLSSSQESDLTHSFSSQTKL
jgi:hypothetical protein